MIDSRISVCQTIVQAICILMPYIQRLTAGLYSNSDHNYIFGSSVVPEVVHCLLCPIHCRINDIEINKVLRFLALYPTTWSHAIMIVHPSDNVRPHTIPLQFEDFISYFEYALPTSVEYKNVGIFT